MFSASSCAENSPVQKIVDEYKAGEISEDSILNYLSDSANFKPVIEWAEKHQDKDDFAKFILGRAYKLALGVERDPLKSKTYYIAAAENGNINAMVGLANFYESYPGYENLDSAKYWYSKAAVNGHGDSYFFLSNLEAQIKLRANTPIDTLNIIKQSIEYWKKGIKLKSPLCLSALASAYLTGRGVELDKTKAFNMLSLVDMKDLDANGLYLLGWMYEYGDGTQQNFNLAFKYYSESAKKGQPEAMCKLGNFYQLGRSVEQNDSLALIQYNKAAALGNAWGQRCVAICYAKGEGTERDMDKAIEWYKTAAKNGDTEAIKVCESGNIKY